MSDGQQTPQLRTDVVVPDASLAVKWILKEPLRAESLDLLGDWGQRQVARLVPGWFACEVANVFYKRFRAGHLPFHEVTLGVQGVLQLVQVRDTDVATSIRGVEIAHTLGRPASYDAHYLAFAERLNCEFWTADERLWNAARGTYPWVRWLGESSPAT